MLPRCIPPTSNILEGERALCDEAGIGELPYACPGIVGVACPDEPHREDLQFPFDVYVGPLGFALSYLVAPPLGCQRTLLR